MYKRRPICIEEKQKIISDIFNIPPEDYDSIADMVTLHDEKKVITVAPSGLAIETRRQTIIYSYCTCAQLGTHYN